MKIVWFDVETSGLDPNVHQIIQLAAVVTCNGELSLTYEAKLRFDESKASPKALELNSYDRDLWEAQAIDEVDAVRSFSRLLEAAADVDMVAKHTGRPYQVARLAGHNVSFDVGFLRAAYDRCRTFLPSDWYRSLDTLQLALWWFEVTGRPRPTDYKLATLCDFFGIKPEAGEDLHDALTDVKLTARLGELLMGSLREERAERTALP